MVTQENVKMFFFCIKSRAIGRSVEGQMEAAAFHKT